MQIKKWTVLASTAMMLSTSVMALPAIGLASDTDTVINERWGKPTFVAGAGLSDTQRTETMNLLGVTADQVNTQTATAADLINYLGSGSGDDSVMLSSVVVTKENAGAGITVDIVTPDNITLITADQYKNPLVTAGVTDAKIEVASVVRVTGESALTGVYKAFDANGETIDADRAQLAQDELNTTTDVAESITNEAANQNNETMTEEEQAAANEAYQTQLNQALVDIKTQLAELQKNSESVTAADVEEAVNKALADNNLADYVSQENINQLVALAQRYLSTDGVLSDEAIDQLKKISQSFQDTLSNLSDRFSGLTDALSANQGFFEGIWKSITDFFSNLFN